MSAPAGDPPPPEPPGMSAAHAYNDQGGLDSVDRAARARARRADLVTLPRAAPGANCGNCKFSRPDGAGFWCAHPQVDVAITARMCCALWDASGALRAWQAPPRRV